MFFLEIVKKIFKKKTALKKVSPLPLPLIRRLNIGPKPERRLEF